MDGIFGRFPEFLQANAESLDTLLGQLEKSRLIRRVRREGLIIIELTHDYLAHRVADFQDRIHAILLRRKLSDCLKRRAETGQAEYFKTRFSKTFQLERTCWVS